MIPLDAMRCRGHWDKLVHTVLICFIFFFCILPSTMASLKLDHSYVQPERRGANYLSGIKYGNQQETSYHKCVLYLFIYLIIYFFRFCRSCTGTLRQGALWRRSRARKVSRFRDSPRFVTVVAAVACHGVNICIN